MVKEKGRQSPRQSQFAHCLGRATNAARTWLVSKNPCTDSCAAVNRIVSTGMKILQPVLRLRSSIQWPTRQRQSRRQDITICARLNWPEEVDMTPDSFPHARACPLSPSLVLATREVP